MAQINEKETSFELVEALLKYIETLQVAGAVLVFLPGWNLIYSMQRHLESNPHFGTRHTTRYQKRLKRRVTVVGTVDRNTPPDTAVESSRDFLDLGF